MSLPCVLRQRGAEPRPVADDGRAVPAQPLVELRQQVQQLRLVLAVPQDAGLVLIQPLVLPQCLAVPRPQLAQGCIHEPPPLRRPCPDKEQVLRREKHGVQHVAEGRAVLGGHTVHGHPPPPAPVQLHLRDELPIPGQDASLHPGLLALEAHQLPVAPRPWALSAAQVYDGLQQVCLALCVFTVDHVAVVVKGQGRAVVIPPAPQRQLTYLHSALPAFCPQTPRCRRGVSFCPAWCTPLR